MRIDISQRIGICYKNEEWAKEVLDQILRQTPKNMIAERMKNGIDFIDGSYIRIFSVDDLNTRGRKLNKIFVQEGVDKEFIDSHLRTCLLKQVMQEVVLDPTSETYFW